ncbi:nuclear transport factor 2 family protein [Shewanella sp. A14]
MTNLEIVKSTYEGATSEENGKNLKIHLAADVSWTEAQGFPYAGTYIGFNSIANNVFQRLATEWENYRFDVEDYVSSGDKVVAYGTYRGRYLKTGKVINARVAHIWTLKEGEIIHFEQFVDSQVVVQAMD